LILPQIDRTFFYRLAHFVVPSQNASQWPFLRKFPDRLRARRVTENYHLFHGRKAFTVSKYRNSTIQRGK